MADDGDLRLVWLRTFVEVEKFRKRTAAAEELGIHQGTVTKHLQSLEKWLGGSVDQEGRQLQVLLLDVGIPAQLLPDGKRFLPIAKQILALLDEARQPHVVIEAPPTPRISGKDIKVPGSGRPPPKG